MPGYRAVLTRDGDYYVSFSKRLQKAKDLAPACLSVFMRMRQKSQRQRQFGILPFHRRRQ